MKPIIIRKHCNGHWQVFLSVERNDVIYFNIEHYESFEDILVILNTGRYAHV